jgi:ketosteroid isomerase-like protein
VVSQENVELVLTLMPDPDADIAPLFRDDEMWTAVVDAFASLLHPDFECIASLLGIERRYGGGGADSFRAFWLDWMVPWETYRTDTQETIDFGERVLQLAREFGRRRGSAEEIRGDNAAIWTFRGDKILRFHAYSDRAEALNAVGLEE